MLKSLLAEYTGRIYVYLDNSDIAKRFLQNAENEGFTFCDGINPTERTSANIMAINRDMTINYIGYIGRIAYQSASKIDNRPLIKVDYREYLKRSE